MFSRHPTLTLPTLTLPTLARPTWRPAGLLSLVALLMGLGACGGDPVATAVIADAATTDGSGADALGDGGNLADAQSTDTAGTADAKTTGLQVTVADFGCITEWTKVRRFRVKSLTGHLPETLAVATDGGAYPAGTVIQLIPTEAMVKHEAGWNSATHDWEFFFLKVKDKTTEIVARGTTEVVNGFKGNCFGCHNKAKPKWDLVCEQNHGCDKLPFSAAVIESLQNADTRCTKK